ncbi:WYL domain-containing protein [Nesterenkonia xinjiangensis]|uniref:Putative DNA-binding transcriptional regulator YafY n=1 Tax=Nesterenkonia xinjiangensis TaxID=225327 RepID=A0A7Z0GNZ9_9MICC|nr:putative DNA-binding transcriptional regulator YafY [Nesterenkonia xinjiangensis]
MVGYRHISRRAADRVVGIDGGIDGDVVAEYEAASHATGAEETQDVTADSGVSRALSLAATLIDAAPSGLTKAEVRERVEHYRTAGDGASAEAFEQQFSRDKRHLRRIGIEITEQGGGAEDREGRGGDHEFRYLIDPQAHGLPLLELDAEEVVALRHTELLWSGTRAQQAIRQASGALLAPHLGEGGLPDVGGPAQSQPSAVRLGLADDQVLDHLAVLAEARGSRVVGFDYGPRGRHRAERRRTLPLGVGSRGGWYLVGHDLDRDAVRVYRLDRIRGAIEPLTVQDDGAAAILQGIAEGRVDPRKVTQEQLETLGPVHGTETVELAVAEALVPSFLPHARAQSAEDVESADGAVTQRRRSRGDGARRLTVETSLHDSFVGKVAAAGPQVHILSGHRLTALVRSHLESVLRAHRDVPAEPIELKPVKHGARNDALVKIARVVSIAAYLQASGGARVSDLLRRYSLEPRQLHRDLLSLQQSAAFDDAQFGHYIDITPELPLTRRVFEERLVPEDPVIRVQLPGERLSSTLGRPLRLSTPQALSLLIGLEGLIASEDPTEELVRAAAERLRDRIRAIVPEELDVTAAELSVVWHSDDDFGREPQLHAALGAGHAVELLYEDLQGRRTRRTVDPVNLLHDGPRTYLRAWCRSAQGERNFLLSRMLELRPLPETPLSRESLRLAAEPARRPEVPRLPEDTLVTLRFAPSAVALADGWAPLREAWHEGGARTVEVALRSPAIAVDLALRSGGDVTVTAPEELSAEVLHRAEAALAAVRRNASSCVEYPETQTKGRTP